MFYDAYHHVVNVSSPEDTRCESTPLVGYICETDTFGWDRKIAEIKEGDILAFKNAGAYSFSMSSNYNSRRRPSEVLVFEGKDYLIRKRETLEDVKRNLVEVELFKFRL
jgi:diaminopimelate decarboxylase